ncbi:hypothetical protein V499_01043 [Pseudogymnoascus sp. VKM F-103]|uniref:Uncharacterized protein n=1 Tax=Pseudogymnoascus verrucosus TaxID=342668 RepID=A0A1B8GPD5_9PEZI|nr:uncharacterized protein VE01_05022 [Pseudogymnoascus verrucosus]KFY80068.1 hypothetical protein V499_01043 [Pseudogymnoascus sp. VKM F-103]OBT97713.1 hypothetical protein VE01_05022 [Pseudogymnoascus verrucosus]
MGNDLASCPTWTLSEATSESYGHTIRAMKLSSFPKFGFVIYRCTYSDDAAWTQLLSLIQREAQEAIKELGPGRDWLGAHLEWTIVEDPTLDDATQEQVKRKFDGWAGGVVEEYERTSTDNVRGLPRFNFCVFVDEKCLASLEKPKAVVDGRKPPVFVVLVRAERGILAWVLQAQAAASQRSRSGVDSEDEEEEIFDDEDEEEVEDEDDIPLAAHKASWMYVETQHLLSLYNSLHADSGWEHLYVRPPGVYRRNEA